MLPSILARRTEMEVAEVADRMPMQAGCIYVAPPDQHLVLEGGVVHLTREPRENGHRPAIDPTFRSVAGAYGARSVGVVLSGTRDDGSRGLATIVAKGGRALVQDPERCLYDGMPRSALLAVSDAEVLAVPEIGHRLSELARREPVA